jgi:hypothetical protein
MLALQIWRKNYLLYLFQKAYQRHKMLKSWVSLAFVIGSTAAAQIGEYYNTKATSSILEQFYTTLDCI